MSIKGIVFLTFWQGLLISILVNLQYEGGIEAFRHQNITLPTNPAPPTMAPSFIRNVAPQKPQGPAPLVPTVAPTSFEGATIDLSGNSSNRILFSSRFEDYTANTDRFLGENITDKEETLDEGAGDSSDKSQQTPYERAEQIQNFLICLEMLFFSIAHWCVFPAEEWEPDYRPQESYAKPGIGLKDFAKDISYIVSSSSSARRYRRRTSSREESERSDADTADGVIVETQLQSHRPPEPIYEDDHQIQ
jgi:Organic solute transporter Ostalpha